MTSPFVRATCGCIVIPLHRPGNFPDSMECIIVRACDAEGWHFNMRSFESWKVVQDDSHNYGLQDRPQPLGPTETGLIVAAIGHLVSMGDLASEITLNLSRITDGRKFLVGIANDLYDKKGK